MGDQQEIETLINEEALVLLEYLRNEKDTWNPRMAQLDGQKQKERGIQTE